MKYGSAKRWGRAARRIVERCRGSCNGRPALVTKNEHARTTDELVPVAKESFQDFGGGAQLGEFFAGQRIEMSCEILDAAPAPLLEKASASGGGADAHAPGVVGIAGDIDQAAALKRGHDAAHGGWLDLLGGGEAAKRLGTGEDKDRERRELRGADTAGCVLLAHAAQEVDGGGMKPVGGCDGFASQGGVFGLDFSHEI